MSRPGFQRRAGASPPPDVLAAFGVSAPARPLPGGQGTSWVTGDLVLKPGTSAELQAWFADLCASIEQVGFRLASPVPTSAGRWTHDGWSATRRLPGTPANVLDPPPWPAVIAAGRAFHRAVTRVDVPAIPARFDAWTVADQAAWGERELVVDEVLASCADRLRGAVSELGERQLVHGDLTGNVLVGPDADPVIIDLSPYRRPPAYAEGIVVADALCWHEADGDLPCDLGVSVAAVARGLLFRLLTTSQLAAGRPAQLTDEVVRYERAASAIGL